MKPVETGVHPDSKERDAYLLARAAASSDSPKVICPFTFPDPLAPLAAARRVGVTLDMTRLDDALSAVTHDSDLVIVEGAGGLLVPVTAEEAFDSLFSRWGLKLVVVAANRLGVINHVRLTMQAAKAASLDVAAVVLNETSAFPADPSAQDNLSLLRELLPATPVISFPWMQDASDLDGLAAAADRAGLPTVLGWRRADPVKHS